MQPQVLWRVVHQKVGGQLYLHHLPLNETDSGADVFRHLQREYLQFRRMSSSHFWDYGLGLYSPMIETAVLSTVSLSS